MHCFTCSNDLISKLNVFCLGSLYYCYYLRSILALLTNQFSWNSVLFLLLKHCSFLLFNNLFWVFFTALLFYLVLKCELFLIDQPLAPLFLDYMHALLHYSHFHCFTYPSYLCRWYLDQVFWSWGILQSVYSLKLMPPVYIF